MQIGFEFIKIYGFQSGHFDEILAAYRATGKFPNPKDFNNAEKLLEKPKSKQKVQDEIEEALNSQEDQKKKEEAQKRAVQFEDGNISGNYNFIDKL